MYGNMFIARPSSKHAFTMPAQIMSFLAYERDSWFGRTIVPPSIRDARNHPLAIGANKVEQVGSAMINLAVRQELKRGPHHRQVVIDTHQRIVNALLDLRGSRSSHPLDKRFKGHLDGLAIAHQHHGSAR